MAMTIETLYEDEAFNELLLNLSRKNLLSFDDFRQEVFLSLIDNESTPAIKIATRVAQKMKYQDIKNKTISLDAFNGTIPDEDYSSVLWEDRHVLAG